MVIRLKEQMLRITVPLGTDPENSHSLSSWKDAVRPAGCALDSRGRSARWNNLELPAPWGLRDRTGVHLSKSRFLRGWDSAVQVCSSLEAGQDPETTPRNGRAQSFRHFSVNVVSCNPVFWNVAEETFGLDTLPGTWKSVSCLRQNHYPLFTEEELGPWRSRWLSKAMCSVRGGAGTKALFFRL